MSSSTAFPRYAIVTGGGRGLGREFCLRLACDGWHIAIVDVDRIGAEETSRMVAQSGGVGRVEQRDVTRIDDWLALRDGLQADWPRLDLLVNNAGKYAAGYVGSFDLAEAERLIQLNLMGVLYGCHTLVPWLIAGAIGSASAGWRAHIINVASSFAILCPPGMAPYNLSKAGVVALSETLHGELKPRGVGVTVVCPGPMPTRFVESASFDSDAFRELTQSYVRDSTLAPAAVAAAALDAARRRKLYVVMGANQRWYWRIKRLAPMTLLSRVARRVRKDLGDSELST
jgi:NAD(P)-dependent dehydrogenase (short-subunit alcohol dehydrogenase family)